MNTLTQIGCRYGTDKADYHGFTEFYQQYIEKFEAPRILEIGIWHGASLRMWDEFFKEKARIVGLDIADKSYLFTDHARISTIQADATDPQATELCQALVSGLLFDIIIDDGGHTMAQQQTTLIRFWPLLAPGGVFIMEDLHSSLRPEQYNLTNSVTTLEVIKGLERGRLQPSDFIAMSELTRIYADIAGVHTWQQTNLAGGQSITSVICKKEQKSIIPPLTI